MTKEILNLYERLNKENLDKLSYIEQQPFCRHCFKKALLRPLVTPTDIYLLCEDCLEKIKNGELAETEIMTYNWTLDELRKKNDELSEKWRYRVYGGGR